MSICLFDQTFQNAVKSICRAVTHDLMVDLRARKRPSGPYGHDCCARTAAADMCNTSSRVQNQLLGDEETARIHVTSQTAKSADWDNTAWKFSVSPARHLGWQPTKYSIPVVKLTGPVSFICFFTPQPWYGHVWVRPEHQTGQELLAECCTRTKLAHLLARKEGESSLMI